MDYGILTYNFFGFLLLAALAFAVGAALSGRERFPFSSRLLMGAILLRIIGSTARYEVLEGFYHGAGDARRYFVVGRRIAESIWAFESNVLSIDFWQTHAVRWWGTHFLENLSGLVLTVIGPTMRGEFLVFSLMAFTGLYLIALSAARVLPAASLYNFTWWLWLWPSLWFWPSSVGKEAVLLLAIGLTFYGFAGRAGRVNWIALAAGLGLSFAIRPHVTVVLAAAAVTAHWLQSRRKVGFRTLVEALLLVVVALVALSGMRAQLGLEQADLEGVQEYLSQQADRTMQGGSSISSVPSGITGIPFAFVNVWMRPFPWEAHNAMALISALEIVFLWTVVWIHRRRLRVALVNFRRHRLLSFAVLLLVLYTTMIGLAFGNLGIIARQRTPLFPFLFLLITAVPAVARRRVRAKSVRPPLPVPAVGQAGRSP